MNKTNNNNNIGGSRKIIHTKHAVQERKRAKYTK